MEQLEEVEDVDTEDLPGYYVRLEVIDDSSSDLLDNTLRTVLVLHRYRILSRTAKTVLLDTPRRSRTKTSTSHPQTTRVSISPNGKRFAYARIHDAINSFVARKQRQLQHMYRQIDIINDVLNKVKLHRTLLPYEDALSVADENGHMPTHEEEADVRHFRLANKIKKVVSRQYPFDGMYFI